MSDNQIYQNDTISFVDVMVVLVRHRRLVIWGTVAAGLLAVLVLYGGPTVGLEVGPQSEFTVERRVVINPLPVELASHVDFDTGAVVRAVATSPWLVGTAYKAAEAATGAEVPPDRSDARFSAMIRRSVIGKSYTVTFEAATDTITLAFTTGDRDFAEAFLEAVIGQIGPGLSVQVMSQLEEAAEKARLALDDATVVVGRLAAQAVERAMVSSAGGELSCEAILTFLDNNGNSAISALVTAERVSQKLTELATDATALYFPVSGATVYEDISGSRSKTVVVTGVSACVLAVLLAFVLEYIRRLKAEPEQMAKLMAAWRRE